MNRIIGTSLTIVTLALIGVFAAIEVTARTVKTGLKELIVITQSIASIWVIVVTYFIVTGLACYCRLEKPLQFYNQESDRWFVSPDNATRYNYSTEAEAVQFGSPGFLGSPIVISAEALASVLSVVRSHAEVKLEQSRRDVESGTTVLRNMSGTISFLESQ